MACLLFAVPAPILPGRTSGRTLDPATLITPHGSTWAPRREKEAPYSVSTSGPGAAARHAVSLGRARVLPQSRRSCVRYGLRTRPKCRSSNSAGVLDAAWHLGCPEAIPDNVMMSSLTDDGSSSVL